MRKMFLKLDGVAGASTSPRHFGEIEITGWSFGDSFFRQGTLALAEAQGDLGKSASDLTVTKAPDKTSQILLEALLMDRKFAEAVITIEYLAESGSLRQSIVLRLKTVAVHSVSTSGEIECVAFGFQRMEVVQKAEAAP